MGYTTKLVAQLMRDLGSIPALILYLIITALFTFIFNKIEKKFSVYE